MLIRQSHMARIALAIVLAGAVLLPFPRDAARAAMAMALYRGEVAATSGGPARRIEMQLKADGTMSLLTDARNNRSPVVEEGHWNPISVEQIDVILEKRDGKPADPNTLHFVKKGDVLQTTPESAAQFGGNVLQLRQTKTAALASAVPVIGSTDPSGAWRWEGLLSAADKVVVEKPELYSIDLQGGGKAAIRADCNRAQAAYKFDGRAVSIKISGLSKNACPPGSLSGRFLKALEAASGQRLRGDVLYLDLPGEGGSMKFVRAK
ncbi:MAG TPA: META domain-containing protein [Burkholderiales bacterium]|nr:META domain-containing protein [Burkholderiales bacterium]